MKYYSLGDSDLEVSVIGFGAWQIGDPDYWGPDAQTDGERAVHKAIDLGINFFDTAELYGNGESERALGMFLGDKRDDVIVASKVGVQNCAPDLLRKSCEDTLRRLDSDHIDLYQIHWPSREVPFEDTFLELKKLQKEGKIRYIGLSNFGKQDLAEWLKVSSGECVSNQLPYNLLFRAIEFDILPDCLDHNIGIIPYVPLLQGLLTGRWKNVEEVPPNRRRYRHFDGTREGCRHGEEGCESLLMDVLSDINDLADGLHIPMATLAIAWLIAQPGVATVPVGTRVPKQITRNIEAADIDLNPETIEQLNTITKPLKQHLGTNVDLWENKENSRIR